MISSDPFDLPRFVHAQERVYDDVLEELQAGQKESHWMWFIFPQIAGLGFSATSRHFAIQSLEEARAYLNHPLLGGRLIECAEIVNELHNRTAERIFGSVDALKFHSSLTLFQNAAENGEIFTKALTKYFNGEPDSKTLRLLGSQINRP